MKTEIQFKNCTTPKYKKLKQYVNGATLLTVGTFPMTLTAQVMDPRNRQQQPKQTDKQLYYSEFHEPPETEN